ncbi:MAG: Flp pilus assembly protein CpaB [Acidimicrobiia bacterium]
MTERRTLIVVAAVVAGLLAALVVVRYLSTTDQRAFDNAELVKVFVVKEAIPRDYPAERAIAEERIGIGEIPRRFRPPSALTRLEDIAGKVAISELSPNQVVVTGQFVDPRVAQRTFSQRIPSGNVAITVSVDQVRGVAGLLRPDDRVNILVFQDGSERVLYQNVQVIAVGSSTAPLPGEQPDPAAEAPTSSNLITFAVPPEAAARIAFAAQNSGGIYLTLVPPDNAPIEVPPINGGNLFDTGLTPDQR